MSVSDDRESNIDTPLLLRGASASADVVIEVLSPTHSDMGTPPLLGGISVPPADADVVIAETTEDWGDFINEANTFIQWMLSTVFLFIPTKLIVSSAMLLIAMWSDQKPVVTSTVITDFLSKVETSYFPRIFLPSILLYAAFYMSARAFKDKRLKFSFEVIGLFIGVAATFVVLYFLDDEGWIYTFGALIVFFLAFSAVKVWDYCFT